MAFVAPNNAQKQELQNNAAFKEAVKWAVLQQALYWKNHQGTGLATLAEAEKWARHRLYAANNILSDPIQVQNQVDQWGAAFAVFLADYPVFDNAVAFNAPTVIAYMIAQGTFQTICDKVFLQKVQTIIL